MTPKPNLNNCPDCEQLVSRHAESCPHCGRFIQNLRNVVVTVGRTGWAGTIAWGVILSWIIPSLILMVGFFILVAMIGGAASTIPQR
jgi:hypothetical protein